jgi:hypothetical protein
MMVPSELNRALATGSPLAAGAQGPSALSLEPAHVDEALMHALRDQAVRAKRLGTRSRRTTLARRLLMAVTALLVPLIVVTVVGVAMFRSSIGGLEAF